MNQSNEVIKDCGQLNHLYSDLPSRSHYISQEEFLFQTGISKKLYKELLELGWLKASKITEKSFLFSSNDVYRVKKIHRISEDFELQALPSAIIVDLLEKIDSLEAQIQELQYMKK